VAPPKTDKNAPHIYRFSRYSTITNLHALSREALEGGVFLALCRCVPVCVSEGSSLFNCGLGCFG
jgi:hypothetical protein